MDFSDCTAFFLTCLLLQTLDIVAENPDKFKVVALAAGSNITLLADQVNVTVKAYTKLQFLWFCLSLAI